MELLQLLQTILIYAIPILFAITVHEVAHGWVANKLGDPTARQEGRLTLNPLKHIDLIGTVIVPLLLLLFAGFVFGWAKPVPVNWSNLRHPKRDSAVVAMAGPSANLVMTFFWALILKLGTVLYSAWTPATTLVLLGQIGMQINLVLLVLNLIPIPPLDGSRVVASILPVQLSLAYSRLEPFGFFILLALIAFGVLSWLILPVVIYLQQTIMHLLAITSV